MVVKRWLITKTSHSSHLTTKAVSNIKRTLIIKWYYLCSGRKGIRPVKTELWGAGVVICLERGADLHMAQLIPLPLTVSCFSKIQIGFTFLVPAHTGSPGHGAVKRVCVCVVLPMSYFCNVIHTSTAIFLVDWGLTVARYVFTGPTVLEICLHCHFWCQSLFKYIHIVETMEWHLNYWHKWIYVVTFTCLISA